MIEFYAAVARKDLDGYQGPGWHPEEAVDRATALKMFTLWPAIGSFQEDSLGSLEPGKRADMTIFSANIMTVDEARIPQAQALYTIIDGAVVYRRP